MAPQAEWSPARIALLFAVTAYLLKTNLWGTIPRLTSRGVPPSAKPRLHLVRRRLAWLVAALFLAIADTGFLRDPLMKWTLLAASAAALLEALNLTIDIRRIDRHRPGAETEGGHR